MSEWDERYLDAADWFANRFSKDPSRKVGAIIVRPDMTVASIGYNGFPRGVRDLNERLIDRATKLLFTVHAESNACLNASESLRGYTIYTQYCPCNECAKDIIQKGISTVVIRKGMEIGPMWKQSQDLTKLMFEEAGVTLREI